MLKQSLVVPILLACGLTSAWGSTRLMVQDFEQSFFAAHGVGRQHSQ